MKVTEFYEKINSDYSEVLERMLGKETLVVNFLRKYRTDPSFSRLKDAVSGGNVEEIFRASHTLKGVVSNLGLKPIMDSTHILVELTRVGESVGVEEAFADISKAYDEVIALIDMVE